MHFDHGSHRDALRQLVAIPRQGRSITQPSCQRGWNGDDGSLRCNMQGIAFHEHACIILPNRMHGRIQYHALSQLLRHFI